MGRARRFAILATGAQPRSQATAQGDRDMRIEARLNVIDGQVLCPRSCRWESPDHCEVCRELARVEGHDGIVDAVICRPEIEELSRTISRLARA